MGRPASRCDRNLEALTGHAARTGGDVGHTRADTRNRTTVNGRYGVVRTGPRKRRAHDDVIIGLFFCDVIRSRLTSSVSKPIGMVAD